MCTAFHAAADAIVQGHLPRLRTLLRDHPELIQARSEDNGATLLHYTAANGVEQDLQKTPSNIVEIARTLLEAGAEPDALAVMYGVPNTTLNMMVSSTPPAKAGLQVPLVELLLDFGAAVDGIGARPLCTALAFGMLEAAQVLHRRGAAVDLPIAAGLGLLEEATRLLPAANAEARHRALSLAAQHGRTAILELLLDAGEDPNRFNLPGNHAHSTPLHQAALGGHEAVIRLLVARGARLDFRDTIWKGTPLGWAIYGGGTNQEAIAHCLRSLGAQE